ncbi:hypothetical protein V8C35DRAFT_321354 [Trichoderma chlorosporum]
MANPPASRPASRDEFEIAIVCALPLEYNAMVILLDHCWDEEGDPYGRARGDNNTYITGSMGGFNIVVLLLPSIGKVEAAASAASLRSSYPEIKLLFLNGICGGVPNVKGEELLLGDVIISKTVVQYDFGNQYPDAFKTKDTIEERLGRASKDIRSFTAILETDRGSDRLEKRASILLEVIQQISRERDLRRRKIAAYAYPGSSNDKLFEASYRHKHHISPTYFVCEASRKLSCDQLGCDHGRLVPRIRLEEKKQLEKNEKTKDAQAPSVFIRRVGSGDTVLKSGIDRDRLAREHDIIAFETEGSGIWDEFPCIIVKGVCDYADSHNNKHEDWQNFAAATAASVVKGLIEHYPKTDQRATALAKNPISAQIEDSRENRECLRDLRSTDPTDDKKRIQMTKGGLLWDSYAWILTNSAFLQWHNDPKCPLLWIRGNPGKGKTMLLCGIVDEMEKSAAYNLSYFFCQQTDSRINNSPSLIAHVQTKYDEVGKTMFEDQNAWVALSQILTNTLQDPGIKDTILIIDALDECFQGLDELLGLMVEILSSCTRVKLLVSSRNEWDIQKRLEDAKETSSVSLELNSASVTAAVASYIRHKVQELRVDNDTQAEVEQYLTEHANGTFLWVALVCDNLKRVPRFQVRSVLATFPPGLDQLYERMMQKISDENAMGLGRQILAIALAVHRPLTILELASLVEFNLPKVGENEEAPREISEQLLGLCGSFLVLQDQTVYFVHQSAKDFLVNKASDLLLPSRRAHHQVLSASLSNMTMTLKKDIYELKEPGYSIYDVPAMDPDPLAAVRYSCVFWIDHFLDSLPQDDFGIEFNDQHYKPVEDFLRSKYLYWLEALVLLRNVPQGVVKMQKLERQVNKTELASSIKELVKDACRFIQEFADAIRDTPLQTYVSALLFSPASSLIHQLFKKDMPNWR